MMTFLSVIIIIKKPSFISCLKVHCEELKPHYHFINLVHNFAFSCCILHERDEHL